MIKVIRSFPAPKSLESEAKKASGKYNLPDVVVQLQKDFHKKCYICEIKPVQDPQVEHRLPHKNGTYRDRKFDWENLFYSCGHCNNIKNQSKYDEGIIDCCKCDPEEHISYLVEEKNISAKALDDEPETLLTVELINEVFNLKNHGIRTAACETRSDELKVEMISFYNALIEFKLTSAHNTFIEGVLKAMLSRESKFAGFKRSYIRMHLDDYSELEKYII